MGGAAGVPDLKTSKGFRFFGERWMVAGWGRSREQGRRSGGESEEEKEVGIRARDASSERMEGGRRARGDEGVMR